MPVTIKSAYIKYKDGQGQYVGIDSVAETSTSEQVAAIEAKGEEVLESIPADYSELVAEVGGKADKVSSPTSGHFAALDGNGNLTDSGHAHSDYQPAVVVETISSTTPSITGTDNHRYICGTVSSISITPPSTGIIDVAFTSGTTPTVLTASGVTWPSWFDSTSLNASTVYDITIKDGYGVVNTWA